MAIAVSAVAASTYAATCGDTDAVGSGQYSAKVPSTLPSGDLIGDDQQAPKPKLAANSRKSAHSGSLPISATNTGSPRKAAVPQDPTAGPIFTPSTSRVYSAGRLGPAPVRRRCSSSTSMMAHCGPPACA